MMQGVLLFTLKQESQTCLELLQSWAAVLAADVCYIHPAMITEAVTD